MGRMIQRLRLQNWRSHSDSEFKFSSGVNALLGIMGSGKSSVMDALCFALFGTFPALNQRKLKIDEVIRSRPEQQTKASVEIEFKDRQGVSYSVIREIELGKGTKQVELRKDGALIESSNSQSVNIQVEKLLKINYDVFSRAVYSEQNELDQFLNIPKGQRMERIDKLLKIDRFEIARKTAGKVVNKFSDELSSKELLSQDILAAEELSNIVELEHEKRELEQKTKTLSIEYEATKTAHNELTKKLEEVESQARNFNEFKLQREGLKERLFSSQKRLEDIGFDFSQISFEDVSVKKSEILLQLENLQISKNKLFELSNKKTGLTSTIEILDFEAQKTKEEFSRIVPEISIEEVIQQHEFIFPDSDEEKVIKEQIEQLKNSYSSKESLEEEIKKQEFRSVEFQKKTESCNERRKHAKDIITSLQEHDNCPLCDSDIGGAKKDELSQKNNLILQQIGQELTNLNAMIVAAKVKRDESGSVLTRWDDLEKQIDLFKHKKESKKEQVASILRRFTDINNKKDEVRNQLQTFSNELIKLETEYSEEKVDSLKEAQRKLDNAEHAFELKTEISHIKEHLLNIESKIQTAGVDEVILKRFREQNSEFIRKSEQQKVQINSFKELFNEKQKRLEDLTRKKDLADKYQTDIKNLKHSCESLEIFQNALKKTQESLRAEFIESVNQIMNDVWVHLYPYDDLSGVKLIVDSGDYVLSVHTSQGWVNVEGRVSGGERSLACLALRVAFSLALAPNLSWLVLDEPTHNLDVTTIDMLGETLRERLPSLIEQIFLITHEERLESAVSGQLYKLERNKELDEPTRIVS
jgi:exonuclease SbcC